MQIEQTHYTRLYWDMHKTLEDSIRKHGIEKGSRMILKDISTSQFYEGYSPIYIIFQFSNGSSLSLALESFNGDRKAIFMPGMINRYNCFSFSCPYRKDIIP